LLTGCGPSYRDGDYCAEVEYYNPNTGTRSTYTLKVELEERYMIKIYWPNGGWLDDDHFDPPVIDERGRCEFTSDRGYKYRVNIISSAESGECEYDDYDEDQDQDYEYDDDYGYNDGSPKAHTRTFEECTSELNMTYAEIQDYKNSFGEYIDMEYTDEMFQSMEEYVVNTRNLRAEYAPVQQEVYGGYIQKVTYFTGYGTVLCHTVIVKKAGIYYLMEVMGTLKCTMGTMTFDQSTNSWQDVIVKESPNAREMNGYRMRIVASSSSQAQIENTMNEFCNL